MGQSGTDVAREAADIVLLDDPFATIVLAVRCGRSVVANIGCFITYVIASNVPEMVPFLGMVALRIPAALTVLQILAVDLGTDLLPTLGLGLSEAVVAIGRLPAGVAHAGGGADGATGAGARLLRHRAPAALQAVQTRASTVTFAQNLAAQMGALLACRSDFRPLWHVLRRPTGGCGRASPVSRWAPSWCWCPRWRRPSARPPSPPPGWSPCCRRRWRC
jgi:Ca2+-transporting ATPase